MDPTSLIDNVANCPFVQIPGLPPWVVPAVCVTYAILETWLGKTGKVKAGSVPELVLNGVKALAAPKKHDEPPPP